MLTGVLGTGLGLYIPLYVYVGMFAAAALSIVWRPRIGLYLLVLLIPLQTTRARISGFPLGDQIIDVLWVSVLLGAFISESRPLIPRTPMKPLLILLILVTYVSLWQGWFYLGGDSPIHFSDPRVSDWKNYMVMPMIAFTAAAVLRDIKQIKIVVLLITVGTFVVDWSFVRSTAGRDMSHFSDSVRDAGVLGYAGVNGIGALLAQAIVLFAALFFFLPKKSYKFALIPMMCLSLYCLMYAFSRGGYLACIAGLSFIALFKQRKLLFGIAIVLIAWQTILPAAVQERIGMTYDDNSGQLEASAGTRVTLWQDALTLIEKNPATGTGFDTYQYMHRIGNFADTHNYYIKVMVEMGIVGLLTLLAVLFQMWRLGFKLYRAAEDPFFAALGLGFAGVVVAIAVANLFGDRWTYLPEDGYLWVLLGCVIRALQIVRDKEPDQLGAESLPTEEHDLAVV